MPVGRDVRVHVNEVRGFGQQPIQRREISRVVEFTRFMRIEQAVEFCQETVVTVVRVSERAGLHVKGFKL